MRALLFILAIGFTTDAHAPLPREERKIEIEQDIKIPDSSAYKRVKLNAAKVFAKSDIAFDDEATKTIVVQLNNAPCSAFVSADSGWQMFGSIEISAAGKLVKAKVDDLVVSHPSQVNGLGALLGDMRRPKNSEDLSSIEKQCINPILDRLLEGL